MVIDLTEDSESDNPGSVADKSARELSQLTLDDGRKNATNEIRPIKIKALPEKLTTRTTGISTRDLKILLKKQDWLRSYTIALPDDDHTLQTIVDATLVFGQEEAGTAVCISSDGLLLTCSHCLAETEDSLDMDQIHCLVFASGQCVRSKCVAWDGKRDLALLEIIEAQESRDSSFSSIKIAAKPPKLKEALVCVGHPGSEDLETSMPGIKTNYDTLHVSVGRFRGYAKDQDLQDNSEIGALKHNCWTYWGHSGAPLASWKTGELIGLHSSWDDATGMRRGIALEAIHKFLKEHSVIQK